MQCAQYRDGIQVYSGIMNMHQQNHLHNLGTYIPECKQPNAGLAESKPLSPQHKPFTNFQWTTYKLSVADMSLLHFLHILQMSQIFSSLLMNYQLLMRAADSRCYTEGEINWRVNVADWNIVWVYGV